MPYNFNNVNSKRHLIIHKYCYNLFKIFVTDFTENQFPWDYLVILYLCSETKNVLNYLSSCHLMHILRYQLCLHLLRLTNIFTNERKGEIIYFAFAERALMNRMR